MKRSLLHFSVLCALAIVSAVLFVVQPAVEIACSAARWVRGRVVDFVLALVPSKPDPVKRSPAVLIVAARAYLARTLKRERPTVQDQWRMCPSI